MAKDILTRLIKSERNATPFLPYARHSDRNVLVTDNGDLVAVFEVLGRAFETADHETCTVRVMLKVSGLPTPNLDQVGV